MSGVLEESLLVLFEERLVEHDESRKEVQSKLFDGCSKKKRDADSLEEKKSVEKSVRTSKNMKKPSNSSRSSTKEEEI